jgi:hypothetical protein
MTDTEMVTLLQQHKDKPFADLSQGGLRLGHGVTGGAGSVVQPTICPPIQPFG